MARANYTSLETAGVIPAVSKTMPDSQKTFWQRYRLPIVLGVIAVGFYLFSIVWIMYTRG